MCVEECKDNVKAEMPSLVHPPHSMPMSKLARFVVLYYSHILTTIPVPIALLVVGLVSPLQAVSLVLLLAGFWTLVGAVLMISNETRRLRRLHDRRNSPCSAFGSPMALA